MKYLLIIFLFACSQPSDKIIPGEDSSGIVESHSRVTIKSDTIPLRINPTWPDPASFTGLKFYRIRVSTDSGTLGYEGDGTITITGDTMSVIRQLLKSIDEDIERDTKLYNENLELRKLIEGLKKQQNEIQHIRFTVDL